MKPLSVHRVEELEKVLELMEQYQTRGSIIAGGTDIIIRLREKKLELEALIDISGVKALKEISENKEKAVIDIGAAVTFSEIAKSPLFKGNLKGLAEAASLVGSPQIRNAATIGGNICNASPAADIVPSLLALEAAVTIRSKAGTEVLPLQSFLIDKGRVKLLSNQLLCSIAFNSPRENQSIGFAKLGLRKALAISRIAVAVFVEAVGNSFSTVRVATGACGKVPFRETAVEAYLEGRAINDRSIEEAAEVLKEVLQKRLEGRPAAEYKCEAVKGAFKEALRKALSYQNL